MAARPASVNGCRTPPGTDQSGWTFLPPSRSITSWPNCRSRMPPRASSRSAAISPKMLRRAGSLSKPRIRSGELRWKKLSACDWTIWARFMSRRNFTAAGGGVTDMIWSPALAEAMRWLTGQMPQTRAVIPGISQSGRPTQNRSKPRNSATWKRASETCPSSPSWIVILAWPSIRVTGSMMIRCPMRVSRAARVKFRRSQPNLISRPSRCAGPPARSCSSTARMRGAGGGQPGK